MSRIRVGIGILGILLVLSVVAAVMMQNTHPRIAQLLDAAAFQAEAGNWPEAQAAAEEASVLWEKTRLLTAALADHSPMDDMDGLFAELRTYALLEEIPHFAAVCRHLSRLAQSMGENHGLLWWNIL